MTSLPRKTGSNSAGGLSAVVQQRAAAAAHAKQSALPSPQYLDAVNVLSEVTMDEVCRLALSEKDYDENNESGEKSDYKKLLEIEKRCREAVKVIHKEAIPAPSNLMMPPSLPAIPASRVNPAAAKKVATSKTSMVTAPKTLVGKTIAPGAASGKAGVIPIRRGSLVGSRPGLQGKRVMPQQLQRAESDDSSLGSGPANILASKKARLTAPGSAPKAPGAGSVPKAPAAGSVPKAPAGSAPKAPAITAVEGKGDAPPPSALNFLKQLNSTKAAPASSKTEPKSRSKGKDKEKEKAPNDETSDADSVASEEESDKRISPPPNRPPPREGVRKNPARGARP